MRRVWAVTGLLVVVFLAWLLFRYEAPPANAPTGDAASSTAAGVLPGPLGDASRREGGAAPSEGTSEEGQADGPPVRVEILDPDDRPVMGAWVEVWGLDESVLTSWRGDTVAAVHTDAGGDSTLTGLDPDRKYRLGVRPPRTRVDVLPLDVPEWRPADETLTLARAFLITGQVIDPGGSPVPRASVLCRAEGYQGQGVLTEEDGTFRVTGLREGSVTLIAVPDTWALTAAGGIPVTVSAGSERVTLTLQPDVDMNLRILNWPFEVPAEGTLRIENCPGARRTQRIRVSEKGIARIEGLRPHLTYSLSFRGPLDDYLPWIQSIPGNRANYSVELTRGLTISGKIVAPEGEWTQYRAYAFGHGLYVNAKVDEKGNYRLGGLVPGTWTVAGHAIQQKPFAFAYGTVKAEAGETADIELTKR